MNARATNLALFFLLLLELISGLASFLAGSPRGSLGVLAAQRRRALDRRPARLEVAHRRALLRPPGRRSLVARARVPRRALPGNPAGPASGGWSLGAERCSSPGTARCGPSCSTPSSAWCSCRSSPSTSCCAGHDALPPPSRAAAPSCDSSPSEERGSRSPGGWPPPRPTPAPTGASPAPARRPASPVTPTPSPTGSSTTASAFPSTSGASKSAARCGNPSPSTTTS